MRSTISGFYVRGTCPQASMVRMSGHGPNCQIQWLPNGPWIQILDIILFGSIQVLLKGSFGCERGPWHSWRPPKSLWLVVWEAPTMAEIFPWACWSLAKKVVGAKDMFIEDDRSMWVESDAANDRQCRRFTRLPTVLGRGGRSHSNLGLGTCE